MALNNLKNEAYKLRMTAEEKAAMKRQIFGMPLRQGSGQAASPYFFFSFQFIQTRVLAPLVVVFLIGSGTAYAAEGALPGDTLYAVKIYVNESVVEALAVSPVARAEVHATLAERRVVEAQALAAEGRLDATTTAELAVNLEAHVEAAEEQASHADAAEAGKGKEVRAKLAATLDTGARVLAHIGEAANKDTKENSESFAVRLIARAEQGNAANARAKATAAADTTIEAMSMSAGMAPAEDPAAQKAVASFEAEAAKALVAARAVFAEVKGSLGATTTEQIEKEFSSIETSMSLGSASLGAGAHEAAEADFTAALTLSVKLQKLLEAHKKFNGNLISPLLDADSGHDHKDDGDQEIKIEIKIPPLR